MNRTIRTTLLIALLSAAAATLPAQNLLLRLGGGLASQGSDARPVGAFQIGVGYEYEFDQHWTFAPSLVFYGKGWKEADRLVPVLDDNGQPVLDEEGEPAQSIMDRSATANYLALPLTFNCYLRTGTSGYVVLTAGPYVACGLNGKIKTRGDGREPGSRKMYYEDKTFDSPGTRRFDAGITFGGGYQFRGGITVGLQGDFSLTRFAAGAGRNRSGLITLAYNFDSLF